MMAMSSKEELTDVGEAHQDMREKNKFTEFVQPMLAEFVGTTLFVFIGTMSAQLMSVGPAFAGHSPLAVAFAHGFTIFILVAGYGHISGGHFNPAVSLGVCLVGELPILKTVLWVLSQLLGGVLGAACTRGCMDADLYSKTSGGATMLSAQTTIGQGIFIEMLLTTLLVTTVLMTAVDAKGKSLLAPLCIGTSIVMCIVAGGFYTGASMNPARSFGPAFATLAVSSDPWTDHYIYWIGPALGAILSALLYRILFSAPGSNIILGRIN